MSKQNDEEDEENECFYESLDRLVSSSCSCSTSNSDDESDSLNSDLPTHDPTTPDSRRPSPFPVPRFPMPASALDIWISEPDSVSERRSRLLRDMGLSRDLALSRVKPGVDGVIGSSDFGRSASTSQLTQQDHRQSSGSVGGEPSSIVRSKSDGAAGQTDEREHGRCPPQRNSSSSPCSCSHSCSLPVCSSSILSIRSHAEAGRTSSASVNNNPEVPRECHKSRRSYSNGGSVACAASRNKPPSSGKVCKKMVGEDPGDSGSSNGHSIPSRNPVSGEATDGTGMVDGAEQVCTIKDLDNGKEFVVNEIREDGMWRKLKEVGTGRQLTMEEFEMCLGHSPIVQELMRRQNVEDANRDATNVNADADAGTVAKFKKRVSWLKSIKSVASSVTGHKERRSSDDRDTSSEKGGRRSSSATDDSQDVTFHGPERVRVRQYGKSCKELTALYKSHEIQAHNGSIWTIKFSLDGRYLASAGEDCVIHVWRVIEAEKKGELLLEKSDLLTNGSPEPTTMSPRRRGRASISRKSMSFDNIVVPESVFGLSEKPSCSFQGHVDDVLDLSWSKSQHLLSSSMDKTVRLWHLSSNTCLKIFKHSDYVTCIQFNPVDDRFFISGSLDAKVRIWSIPDGQVVDWNDLHEMVTAACYTPDGQGALVGTNKGSCRLYNTSDNKLQQKRPINLQNKKKKPHHKKITGFQFVPGSSSEVLITSADSRIRVVDGVDLVHKFKGFRNSASQISASFTSDGKYIISASEDSHVYVWKYEAASRPSRSKGVTVTNCYEHFHCQDVSVAIPWPGLADTWGIQDALSGDQNGFDTTNLDEVSTVNHPPTPIDEPNEDSSRSASGCSNSPLNGIISSATNSYLIARISATCPEEKLLATRTRSSPRVSAEISSGSNTSAWCTVIVTAGLRGEIRTYQNFGLPVRI